MSKNTIGSDFVAKEERNESELIKADVKADISVVLPLLSECVDSDIVVELDYNTITQVVNDYIERYTIDPRISEIAYDLSTPQLPDEETTNNLKGALTGETNRIISSEDIIQIDNNAIVDEKVTLKFELSVEENVYLNESAEDELLGQGKCQPPKMQKLKNGYHQTDISNSKSKGDLAIQSAGSQLYWQNAPSAQLYWQNAPTNVSMPSKKYQNKTFFSEEIKSGINHGLEYAQVLGTGVDSAMSSATETAEKIGNVNVGSNGKVYTNPRARGNQYYKIVGSLANNKTVQKLGVAGKVISYGTTIIQTGTDCANAKTSSEKGEIIGASVGKVATGATVGGVASMATTAVLVAVAGAAGVAAAPITIIVIAGCSIVAGVAASTVAEQYGEDLGEKAGVKTVEFWQDLTKK